MSIKQIRTKTASSSSGSRGILVAAFFEEYIQYYTRGKRLGTARNYNRTLHSLQAFLGSADLPLSGIDEKFVANYEKWLLEKGVSRNSSSFYLRNLRSIYNKAVQGGLVAQTFPFRNVYTGVDRTRKRAVDEAEILRLLQLDLDYSKPLTLARDLFVFSYCARGMSFVDISFLKKRDVADGMISYVRRKTGQRLSVRIEPCIEKIIKRYAAATEKSIYVFPVITASEPEAAYKQYQIALNYHNRKLKILGREIGNDFPLSSYTARHTWATAARRHNVPLAVISEGMGHTSERTTQIYLASLENSVIDEANKRLLQQLNCVGSL